MNPLTICLIIFALTVISFAVNYFSMATTALLSVLMLAITGCIDTKTALSGFSNTNTIILVSMFIVSAGLNRTQMVKKLSGLVHKVSKGSFTKILLGYVLVTFMLTQFIRSAMAVFCIVYPLAVGICSITNIKPSKIMFSLGVVTIATNCILPIGAGATIFTEFNGYLQTYDYAAYQYQMLDPCIARLPVAILIIVYMVFVAPRFAPDHSMLAASEAVETQTKTEVQLDPVREFFGYGIFVLVILGPLFQSHVGLENWQITMMGALLMVATGVLKPAEAVRSMNLNIALLYVGALGIGAALVSTGAGDVIGQAVAMVMNGGGYDIKTLLKMSILPAILICILSVGWIMTYFPAY